VPSFTLPPPVEGGSTRTDGMARAQRLADRMNLRASSRPSTICPTARTSIASCRDAVEGRHRLPQLPSHLDDLPSSSRSRSTSVPATS
jgi:hypothetical protein